MPVTHATVAGNPQTPRLSDTDWNANHTVSVSMSEINATGTPSSSTYLRGDATWATIAAGVTGPGSSTTTALARWNGTAGNALSNSGVTLDASNNMAGLGTVSSGAQTITSSSANALAVGRQGTTNPGLLVDASAATCVTGFSIASKASGGGCILQATSTNANEETVIQGLGFGTMRFNSPGSGQVQFQMAGNTIFVGSNTTTGFTNINRAFTPNPGFYFRGTNGSGVPVSTEILDIDFDGGYTMTHQTGALALQRQYLMRSQTLAFSAASTCTTAAVLSVESAVKAGSNATITTSAAIHTPGGAVGAGVTNSYAAHLTANSGATNNYIASHNGSAGEVFRTRTDGQIALLATNTAAGTTGAQTINRPSGTVNFAAAATSLVVTNSLCTTSSIVFATIRTNDATAVIKNVVPGSGSFTINLNAAATAETSVGFLIIN